MPGGTGAAMVDKVVRRVMAALSEPGGGSEGKGPVKGKGKGKGPRPFLAGDWYCESVGLGGRCGCHNFAYRTACFRCGTEWTQRQLAGNQGTAGKGGRHGGVGKGPVGAAGSKPLLAWGGIGGVNVARRTEEKKPADGSSSKTGAGKKPKVARGSDGFTTMLRGGKPREATAGSDQDDLSERSRFSEDEEMGEEEGDEEEYAEGEEDEEWDEEEDWYGEGDHGSEGEEEQGENDEREVDQATIDELRHAWECEKDCLKQVRQLYPKGHNMRDHGEKAERRAYEAWNAVRPQRSSQDRTMFQGQKLARAKAKLQKRADELEALEAELLPRLEEARRLVAAAKEKVQKEQACWEELLWEGEDGQGTGGGKSADGGSDDKAIGKAIETSIGPRLAQAVEAIDDGNPAKPSLILLLQEMGGLVGGKPQRAASAEIPIQFFNLAAKEGTGSRNTEGDKAGSKEGGGRGCEDGRKLGNKGAPKAKKKHGKGAQGAERSNEEAKPRQEGGGEETLADDARKAGKTVEAADNLLHARASEARSKAEASMVEPMRSRLTDLDMQARAVGRDLFKDMVSEGMDGEKVSTAWIANYVARHGFC